jgi:IS5 family transposase
MLDEVYADSAYANKQNDKKLGKQNNKVLHCAYRNKPLTKQQKQDNKQRSSIRYIVERTFGRLKLHHGLGKARYLRLERNKAKAPLIAMRHLKTGMTIFKQMQSSQSIYSCFRCALFYYIRGFCVIYARVSKPLT